MIVRGGDTTNLQTSFVMMRQYRSYLIKVIIFLFAIYMSYMMHNFIRNLAGCEGGNYEDAWDDFAYTNP